MELKITFDKHEMVYYLIQRGYQIEDSLFDGKKRILVKYNNRLLNFHWNKLDFTEYDQVNNIFTKLIKEKLLEV